MPNHVEKTCEVCNLSFTVTYKLRNKQTCSKECSYKLRMTKRKETRESSAGEQKVCEDCGGEYLDPTRRLTMKRCNDCTQSKMVKTRREGGTYVQSEERRKWQSEMLKRKYAEGWNPNTPEHREKLSRSMKERWQSGKMDAKVHWTQTSAGRLRVSTMKKGTELSDSARKNMSESAARRVVEGRHFTHRGRGGIREDLGFYVRSSWEANFARVLRYQSKSFDYEPDVFRLKSGKAYVPDFKVGDCYYEVKGYLTQASSEKLKEFREQYPNVELKIVGPVEYNELYSVYGGLVNWE